jgi:hypothetical protein
MVARVDPVPPGAAEVVVVDSSARESVLAEPESFDELQPTSDESARTTTATVTSPRRRVEGAGGAAAARGAEGEFGVGEVIGAEPMRLRDPTVIG